MHDFDWSMLCLCLFGSILAGLLIFHVTAGYYHLRYYVLRREDAARWKCQPNRWLRPEQQREAALLSSFNLTMGGAITGVLIYAMTQGWETPIYLELDEYGWVYTILSTIGLFVANDAAAYYVHRALHIKPLFKRFHRYHHRYVATSPYVTTAVHPVELLALQTTSFLPLFFIPFWAPGIGLVLTYILVWNIMDHSGVKMGSILPWQGPSTYHDDHHALFHVNFGQHLMIFDRLHGTLRRQGRTYGVEHFGGRGDKSGTDNDGFIRY